MRRWIFTRAATIPIPGWLANTPPRPSRAKSVLTTEFKRGIEKSDGEFTHVIDRNANAETLSA